LNLIQSLILGTVQGLTEFIPVSSSGHLVLLQRIFGLSEGSLTFTVFVHFGTLIAVLVVYYRDIIAIIRKPWAKLPLLLLTGAAVTGVIGIAFTGFFRSVFESGQTVGVNFLITGAVLFFVDRFRKGNKGIEEMTYLDAVFVGLMQAFSIMPAISRSGMTISGALLRGMDREQAARYSFLLSVPVILGASAMEAKDLMSAGLEPALGVMPILVGTLAAAIAGYFAIHYMLRVLTRGSLRVFSYYVFALGILVLFDQIFTQIYFPPLF
jgi:undecaprenyl-diphosphatase